MRLPALLTIVVLLASTLALPALPPCDTAAAIVAARPLAAECCCGGGTCSCGSETRCRVTVPATPDGPAVAAPAPGVSLSPLLAVVVSHAVDLVAPGDDACLQARTPDDVIAHLWDTSPPAGRAPPRS